MANQVNFRKIYVEASEAGETAANALVPAPMVLQEVGIDDKPYPGSKSYYVPEGACGFAWIKIRPANCAFAKWLKSEGIVDHVAYNVGYDIWISQYGQSIDKKEAHANAAAEVLRIYGINAYGQSRLN
jgi:hypothetical protein